MSFDVDQVALDIARKYIQATDPQTLAKLQVDITGVINHVIGLKDEEIAKSREREYFVKQRSDEVAERAMQFWKDTGGLDPVGMFKNFHRSLCARFGEIHDEQWWWRDLVSLEEIIANNWFNEEIYEAYMKWPEDIRKKISIHDLRRMNGWMPRRD